MLQGDPTVFGNMPPHPAALDAIEASLRSGRADGYPESVGYADARQAVADYFDEGASGNWRITKRDVVMTHGASGALEMVSFVAEASGKQSSDPLVRSNRPSPSLLSQERTSSSPSLSSPPMRP